MSSAFSGKQYPGVIAGGSFELLPVPATFCVTAGAALADPASTQLINPFATTRLATQRFTNTSGEN